MVREPTQFLSGNGLASRPPDQHAPWAVHVHRAGRRLLHYFATLEDALAWADDLPEDWVADVTDAAGRSLWDAVAMPPARPPLTGATP